jgi:protein-S-isoprenylcysteine O-methyltransferase Ste14
MQNNPVKLPVILVLLMALLMYMINQAGSVYAFSFSGQPVAAIAVFILGSIIIAISGYSFRKANTTVNPLQPEKTTSLVMTGLYRFSRNPMYIGFLLWLFAWAIYLANFFNFLFLPLFIILANRFYILPEEIALEKLFTDEFVEYRNKVRRWL